MTWSWNMGRLAGIQLRMHATFLLLLAWAAWAGYRASGSTAGAIAGVLFIVALFASVVLHELGHALTARRFGIPTREITLLPIGGVARLERMPSDPRQELLVALAGPAVTVLIAVVLYGLLALVHAQPVSLGRLMRPGASFIAQLLWSNVVLAIFNLIPAFPMDGGRVLRSALAMKLGHARATTIAAQIGRGFAVLFGVAGYFIFHDVILILIAFFIWAGASAEIRAGRSTGP